MAWCSSSSKSASPNQVKIPLLDLSLFNGRYFLYAAKRLSNFIMDLYKVKAMCKYFWNSLKEFRCMHGLVNVLIFPVIKFLSEIFGNQDFWGFFSSFHIWILDLFMEKPVYVEFSELSFVPLMKSSYIIRTLRKLLQIMVDLFHFQEFSLHC